MGRQKKLSRLKEGFVQLALVGWVGWSLYNLYSLVRYGVVFLARKERHGGSGWLAPSDDPFRFGVALFFHALPLLMLLLAALAWALNRRYAGRPASREFFDGGGPPAIRRRPDER